MTHSESLLSVGSPRQRSLFRTLHVAWQARRRRNLRRRKAYVRFHLTREGWHFLGILLFIFFGAVLREINLMILLAGTMIGLILLQWRISISTIAGLQVQRRHVRTATAGQSLDVEVCVTNPKRWLSAWLVLVEDHVVRMEPRQEKISIPARCVVECVRPRASACTRYQLVFRSRGRYRVVGSTISSRYPLALGRGWREVERVSEVIVHPTLGRLTHRIARLLEEDQIGQAKQVPTSGLHEGEFFGLRPWSTGDSRRWIHWRTTARLNQLMVRQFEKQQQRCINVVLDLVDTGASENEEAVEVAVSFVATLASQMVRWGRDKLSVAIAAKQTSVVTDIQSPALLMHLLERLAVASPAKEVALAAAVEGLSVPLVRHPNLLVVSTRPAAIDVLRHRLTSASLRNLLDRTRIHWINVAAGELSPYFLPNNDQRTPGGTSFGMEVN